MGYCYDMSEGLLRQEETMPVGMTESGKMEQDSMRVEWPIPRLQPVSVSEDERRTFRCYSPATAR